MIDIDHLEGTILSDKIIRIFVAFKSIWNLKKGAYPPIVTVMPLDLSGDLPSTESPLLKAFSSISYVLIPSAFCLDSLTKPSESFRLTTNTSILSLVLNDLISSSKSSPRG
jgi:hypothetical protein